MKPLIIKFLTGNAPRIKVAVASAIIGGATWLVQRAGYENGAEWSAAIATIATTLSGWILDGIAAKLGHSGVKAVQDVLRNANYKVIEDGDAGKITMGTLIEVMREAGYSVPEPVPKKP